MSRSRTLPAVNRFKNNSSKNCGRHGKKSQLGARGLRGKKPPALNLFSLGGTWNEQDAIAL